MKLLVLAPFLASLFPWCWTGCRYHQCNGGLVDSARGVAFFSEQVEIVGGVPILNHHVASMTM